MRIGIAGTGRMGTAIALRLLELGHEVGVWNRDAAKTKPLTGAGAKLFASPAELVQGCDAIVVVSAPPEIQRQRAFQRPGMTEAKFLALLAKQTPDAEKRRRADFVLDSSQDLDHARAQVSDILQAVAKMTGR